MASPQGALAYNQAVGAAPTTSPKRSGIHKGTACGHGARLPASLCFSHLLSSLRSSLEEDRDSLEHYRGSRKAYRDEISPKFARRFAEGIGKLTGSTSGDHREKTGRLTARVSEATELA
ncbi:hypothetical protein B296_00003246 [Ensete ventricosum]|uniref:Uncharacterized protein n=1 Tax=Ensete ventricosum TaxID=4639 RepID=A0A427AAN7_ENSVE|nr:hypothetical protein B296_00003246 [Ensete ventricosum]